VIGTAGALGILIPPVDRDGHLRRVDQLVDRPAVHRGIIPGLLLAALLMFVTWAVAEEARYPRMRAPA